MFTLSLIGIGSGNPDHVTVQGIKALNAADLVLIPLKGAEKTELAALRHQICDVHLSNPKTKIAAFDLPVRDTANLSYHHGVNDWHDAIAEVWAKNIAAHPDAQNVAMLIWGDPSLYDSALRIAARLNPAPNVQVVPGITAIQALTAAHAIPFNDIGAPVVVTTGRQLRDHGFPTDADSAVIMLDGQCSFDTLPGEAFDIWWGAYVGMDQQVLRAGRLQDVADDIKAARTEARQRYGWVMDVYLLRRR
ncbi:precorrin 6A synthase [Actibacterium mucosum KCTC 23349]|uniref:Precorrin-6A synthase [deacetylating] n=1 Tax=Actibacterium mucosum KCTC 23349 TaxID=1454373 RepID=A0A037ZFB1_9RHOB|nr:precorrin-6A synthase (deacetylating) [Actibacterium mucosum]KAJ55170.1 precorrin 6A synthase [Actibacterium mucosum KCTC 23349]